MDDISEQILELAKKKMREQGAYDRQAYKEFISETIEYFKEKGKITEDDEYELIENNLEEMWESVENELANSHKS
jgi:hypothetical protein